MLRNNIIYTSFCNWRFGISKAKDSYIWDQNRHKLIDFTSGWNNPEIIQAIKKQKKKISHWLKKLSRKHMIKDFTW